MAAYFWVGGTGTWNNSNTANWAIVTGGVGGFGPPTSADSATFDANSGTGTCTTASTATCDTPNLNTANILLVCGANFSISNRFILTLGTFNLNNFTLSAQFFLSNNSNVRSIAFGTGQITLTGGNTGGVLLDMQTATNFSYTGTSKLVATYAGAAGTRNFRFASTAGASSTNVMNLNINAGTDTLSVIGSFLTLDYTGFKGNGTPAGNIGIYANLTLDSGMTSNASPSGYFFYATSGTQQITSNGVTLNNGFTFGLGATGSATTYQIQGALTISSAYTATLNSGTISLGTNTLSTGLFSSTNANTRAIAFGTGNITTIGSGTVWNTSSTTGFSYTGTPTVNISNNSATATTVSTGSMTSAQALNFNYTIGTYTLTDTAAVYKSVNFTGFSGTIPNSTRTIYGGLTISAGMTLTAGANVTTFAATSGTNNITTAAKTLDFPVTFFGLGGTFAFQDALTQGSTRAFTITAGTVQLKASATSTTGVFATSGASQKFLQSTTPGTQATLTQASGTVDASHLTIKDINAVGGATWLAYTDQSNADAGNVDGWNFGISPVVGGAEYTYTLRSFTQPRRF